MSSIFQHAAEETAALELPFPAFVFGVIAMAIFITLAFVTWSYRDVANRHEHKAGGGHH